MRNRSREQGVPGHSCPQLRLSPQHPAQYAVKFHFCKNKEENERTKTRTELHDLKVREFYFYFSIFYFIFSIFYFILCFCFYFISYVYASLLFPTFSTLEVGHLYHRDTNYYISRRCFLDVSSGPADKGFLGRG